MCCYYEDILLRLENIVIMLQPGFSCHLFHSLVSSSSQLKSLLQQYYLKLTRKYKLIYNMISQKSKLHLEVFVPQSFKALMRPTYFNSCLVGRILGIRFIQALLVCKVLVQLLTAVSLLVNSPE